MRKKNNELTIKAGQMIYTNQRRRELNKALFSKLQNPLITTLAEEGDSHIFLEHLPKDAEEIPTDDCLMRNVPRGVLPWNQVMPVFIPAMYNGKKAYLVNYVNNSQKSIQTALEKLNTCGMYYIPGMTLEKGVDYGWI